MKVLLRHHVAGCFFAVMLAGVFTATSAMGGKYSDVISINLTDGSASGSVSGSVVGMNGTVANWFNDIPSASTHTLAAGFTANGVAVPALSLNMFDGGWNALGTFNTASQPVNTLGRSGISEGEMINNWGQVRNDVQFVSGLPPGFDAANSELWGYVALHSQTATFQWLQYTYNKDGYYYMQPFPNGNGAGEKVSVGAYQLWKLSPQAPSIHVLGTNSLSITNSAPAAVTEGTDFGVIIANSAAVTNIFVITNSGTIALYLTNSEIVVLTGDTNCFAVSTNGMTTDVAADSFTTFSLAFSPATLGTWTGIVTIANSDTNSDPYCLSVRGTVVPAIGILGINYASITNGDVTPNTDDGTDFAAVNVISGSRDCMFTVTNSGSDALCLAGSNAVVVTGTHSNDFAVTMQPTSTNIAASSSETFTIRFVPTNTGLRQASISIANSDTNANPYRFNIQGTGTLVIASAMSVIGTNRLTITNGSAASIAAGTDFGGVYTNVELSHVFGITNTGTGMLYLDGANGVVVGGVNSNEFTVTVQPALTNVAVWGGTHFTVQFHPTNTGLRQASISIVNNDASANPYCFSIQGTGFELPVPAMAVLGTNMMTIANSSPASVASGTDFGTMATNVTLSHAFSIVNTGTGPLCLYGSNTVAVVGTHSNDFTVTAQPTPTNVAAGSETTFTVRFNPTALGLRSAILSIANNDSGVNPYVFDIQGIATEPRMYTDAINVNYGTVTGEQATPQTPYGILAASWNNITAMGPGYELGRPYLFPVWGSTPVVTAMGASAPSNFMCNVQNGGWGPIALGAGPGPAGTLFETVALNNSSAYGEYPAHWNWLIQWENLPASFTNYDVYAWNDGVWEVLATNQAATSGSTTPHLVRYKTAAIQFLQMGVPTVDNEPGPIMAGFGMFAGLRGRCSGNAKVWVYWGTNDGQMVKADWDTNACMGNVNESPVSFTNWIGRLGLNTTYYYRYYATNVYGVAWAPSTTNFLSEGGSTIIVR